MKAYRHRVSICPGCRHVLNASVDPRGRGMPRPGDLSVCINCGTVLKFDQRLKLVAVTPEEIEQLPPATAAELIAERDRRLEAVARKTEGRIVVP